MKEIKKEDIKQEVFDLYDDYAHSRIERREFIQKLSAYAVGGITVTALMSFLMPAYASSIQVKPDDPRLKSDYVYFDSPKGGGKIKALLSIPIDTKQRLGGIVVVHENRGLNPYIEDVARRAALADSLRPVDSSPSLDQRALR